MSEDRVSLLASVDRTVGAASTEDVDAALVHLVQLYARQIDHSAMLAVLAERAVRAADAEGDAELSDMVRALRAKLSERDTLDRLGARMHAALVELQATPKARAGSGPAKPAAAGASTLAGLRVAQGATG